jgi:toxin YoeB
MAYRIKYHRQAIEDAKRLQREDPKAFKKLLKLEGELKEHPRSGTGKPEPLPFTRPGEWSRRISRKHRLIYEIRDTEVIVIVISAYGHYGDN